MDPAVVRRTQENLGRVIRKPQLSDKYLNKPPFRFLHDIISEVIRTTGFMRGLYTEEEMKSENFKDRDSKMSYLQKAVDVVALVTGEALQVKPARVVAGQEPERTNQLLQAIAHCCLSKCSSEEAVRTVLSEHKPQEKENEPRGAEGKSRKAKPDEPREKQKNGESDQRHKEKERERREKKEEKREEQERRDEKQKRGEERERREKKEDREKRAEERERKDDRERKEKKERGEEREKRGEGREKSKEKVRSTDREREKEREPHRKEERERERDRHREREREKEKERKRRERDQDGTRSKPREEEPPTQVKTEEPPQNTSPEEPPKPVAESSARIPRPSSAKGQRRRAKVGSQDDSDSEGEAEVNQKHPESTDPPAPSRRMVRPSSARLAPPRLKRQESHAESPAERLPSAKISTVILDGGRRTEEEEEDEDEQFLVQEAVAAAAEAPDPRAESTEATGDATHGGLVKKILETKKYYEVSEAKAQGQEQQGQVQQGLVQREMERLRASVQSVCRNALPLGKIMDYFQEDVDAMMTELQQWRQENKQNVQALQEQHRLTEGALLPLRTELMELESLIQEQKAQTCALRCSVLKNEEKIHKMLTGLHQQN
ncbi:TRAF3-interacting protein 1 [Periophthalmus magnuspinnatus]|uniref:TRAF3-interacting protein 1 n=1 Tax=Periophthalmus magnuspinnatus TaxID=409849 RepID=UPI0024369EA1|nr:TRAF3-interacting protein 1 [Periophthalmus magnuspinnatus]